MSCWPRRLPWKKAVMLTGSKIRLEARPEVAPAAICHQGRQKFAWHQRLAVWIARRSPDNKDRAGRSPEGRLAATIGLKCHRKFAIRSARVPGSSSEGHPGLNRDVRQDIYSAINCTTQEL